MQRKGRKLVLVKHAMPILDPSRPARAWVLGDAGEAQARALAPSLAVILPATLVSSIEPKARRTAELLGAELGVPTRAAAGLEEIDRPVLPIVDRGEHRAMNRPIFEDRGRPRLGDESADVALTRFARTVERLIEESDEDLNLIVVTHGTVMALFAAEQSDLDPWQLWQRLECCDTLVFELPGLRLLEPECRSGR